MTRTPAQTCKTCFNFDPSRLEGYGYCKAAPTLETLARLVHVDYACVFGKWREK